MIATVGYVGYAGPAPGTVLSAIVCLTAYFFPQPRWIEAVCAVSAFAGFAVATSAVRVLGSKDPRVFVLDELAGMTLTLGFLPLTPAALILGFLLFRIFDIVKPFGVKRLDRLQHPSGIVWDDLLAGLYANLALRCLLYILK